MSDYGNLSRFASHWLMICYTPARLYPIYQQRLEVFFVLLKPLVSETAAAGNGAVAEALTGTDGGWRAKRDTNLDEVTITISKLKYNKSAEANGLNAELFGAAGDNLVRSIHQLICYADDIDIIGRSKRAVLEAFTGIEEQAKLVGLQVNEDKTKYMLSTNKATAVHSLRQNVTLGSNNFEVVKEFTYIGTNFNPTNDTLVEIRRRITLTNRCCFGLAKQLGSELLTRKTKCLLYKTVILPALLYGGAECWTISKKRELILGTFERKILRRIFAPVCDDVECRRRYNRELYELFQDGDCRVHARDRSRWKTALS
ncbi:uncharacterized protein LOC129940287 [Eupeodes corollae]|uniref:uncharacterized protein LOC129940287 n=1 Tax=Eupeodes corollae TaxID=290404 RepID=UPI0024928F60|nr:uncharacterized protein LOC129940287 [Eupeodes corollae]